MLVRDATEWAWHAVLSPVWPELAVAAPEAATSFSLFDGGPEGIRMHVVHVVHTPFPGHVQEGPLQSKAHLGR